MTTLTATAGNAGVYVHFPWCLAKCPYCDFVSYAVPRAAPVPEAASGAPREAAKADASPRAASPDGIDHAGYADAVLSELNARARLLAGRRVGSVFFGGGTPSLWEPHELGRVLAGIRRTLTVADDLEVTVECNPTSIDEERARALVGVGVNRVSIGVQSLDNGRLRHLGRLHDADGGRTAIKQAMRAGLSRVSGDLIFGLPGQSPAEARDEALQLVELGVAHLSCYQLTIEPGTRFGELARRGRLPLADDGAVADSFMAIDEALHSGGFRHYEVSNYARRGHEARHNVGYWLGEEYLGLGCAAVGFVRSTAAAGSLAGRDVAPPPTVAVAAHGAEGAGALGVRYRNAPLPDRYVEAARTARPHAPGARDGVSESSEDLDGATLLRERIMLGLRIDEGIDIDQAGRALETPGWTHERTRAAALLEARGRVVLDGPRVRIPRSAWLWADDTAARLM